MKIAGVDPGLQGGIAIMNDGEPIAAFPLPLNGRKKRLDLGELQSILITYNVQLGVIEQQRMNGKCNGCKIQAVFELCSIPFVIVHPATWQTILPKELKKIKDTKQRTILYCQQQGYPVPDVGVRVLRPHDGIADSWCIAEYGSRRIVKDVKQNAAGY